MMFASLSRIIHTKDETFNIVPLHVNVGIGVITEQDIGINVHFNSSGGNIWVISQSYAVLREIDSAISKLSKKICYVPFPILDKYTLKDLHKEAMSKDKDSANFIIIETYRKAFERWIHTILQRQHLLQFSHRELIRELFHLPNGFSYVSKYLDFSEKASTTTATTKSDNIETKSNKSGYSTSRAGESAPKKLSIMGRLKSKILNPGLTEKALKSESEPQHVEVSKDKSKMAKMVDEESKYEDELMSANPLVKVSCTRRLEGRKDRIEYEIYLVSEPIPIVGLTLPSHLREPYSVCRHYKDFHVLNKQLEQNNVLSIKKYASQSNHLSTQNVSLDNDSHGLAPSSSPDKPVILLSKFPLPPAKTSLGIAMNETELSFRARRLDQWIREVLMGYKDMSNSARELVRRFLKLDLSRPLDISIQDRLAQGLVEASRAEIAFSSLSKILPALRHESHDQAPTSPQGHAHEDLETMSQYSKNSHHSINSTATLSYRIKDEDMITMQHHLLFNNKSSTAASPTASRTDSNDSDGLYIYVIVNASSSPQSPYLEPHRRLKTLDKDREKSLDIWSSILTRIGLKTTVAENVFFDMSSVKESRKAEQALVKRSNTPINHSGLSIPTSISESSASPQGSASGEKLSDDNATTISHAKNTKFLNIGMKDNLEIGMKATRK